MHTISPSGWVTVFCGVVLLGGISCTAQTLGAEEVRGIGSRLELFVDEYLIESMNGLTRKLHSPQPQDVAIRFDRPWEGWTSHCVTVFPDGDLYRMYYRGQPMWGTFADFPECFGAAVTCYAESRDGIHWTRPELDIFAGEFVDRYGKPYAITAPNNIVWIGQGKQVNSTDNFVPFKDTNPDCKPEARYKAIGRVFLQPDPSPPQPDATGYPWPPGCGLLGFQSPDGIHWSLMQEERIIKKTETDAVNVAFWDSVRGLYVCYTRVKRKDGTFPRSIATLTSEDFLHWSDPPEWLDYGGAPEEHMYDPTILPYFRAPHISLGLIHRFMPGRQIQLSHPAGGVSDGVLMASRDGVHFDRSFMEGWIRPGLDPKSWMHAGTAPAWGLLQTGPEELSVYWVQDYYEPDGTCYLQRGTLRVDGFVSVHADYAGGEFITKPLTFMGSELVMNYSTSAVGSMRVEIQDQEVPKSTAMQSRKQSSGSQARTSVRWPGRQSACAS